jgi:hypothetical protein
VRNYVRPRFPAEFVRWNAVHGHHAASPSRPRYPGTTTSSAAVSITPLMRRTWTKMR